MAINRLEWSQCSFRIELELKVKTIFLNFNIKASDQRKILKRIKKQKQNAHTQIDKHFDCFIIAKKLI